MPFAPKWTMRLLNPGALYLLISVPIVILLYFLKLRRQTIKAPSIILWMTAVEDMKANVPFRRFRKNLLLPLQLLFLTTAILGLARPAYVRESRLGQHTALIIDVSASMQSVEDGKSLLEMAQNDALKMVDEMPENGQMMLVEGSLHPSIVVPFTNNKSNLRNAIENISPTDYALDLKEAVDLALSSSQEIQETDIIVLTDRNFVDQSEITPQAEGSIKQIRYGKGNRNVAITRFDVSRKRTDRKKYQAFAEIQNFDEKPHDVLAWLLIDGHRIQSDSASLKGKERREFIFEFDDRGFDGKVLEIRLETEDSLSIDNSVHAILHKFEKQRVLVISDTRNLFLEQVLLTNPDVEFRQIKLNQYIGMAGYDVVLFYKVVPYKIPDGNILFVYPEKGLPFMRVLSKDENVSVVSVNPTRSIMRDVNLGDLKVKESLVYEMPPWSIPLVESTSSPLIWLGEWRSRKGIIFAFDAFNPRISRLVLTRAFPILMAQCLQWLGKANRTINPDQVKAGSVVEIQIPHFDEVEKVIIDAPGGRKHVLLADESSVMFGDTYKTGVYQVYADDDRLIGKFAVNLLDEDESNLIRTSEQKQLAKQNSSDVFSIKKSYHEVWHYLAIIALTILVLEWWIYHRRVLETVVNPKL